jgi:hypothetical protein
VDRHDDTDLGQVKLPSRVPGSWQAGPFFLQGYGCLVTRR